MRAAVLVETNRIELEELSLPPVQPHEVVVNVRASGLCHSDLFGYRDPARFQGPVILGHEVAGVVEAVGSAVSGLTPGDRVVGSWAPECGHCAWCLEGEPHLCRELWASGLAPRLERADGTLVRRSGGLGCFAEMMLVGERSLVKVQTDVPDEQLALVGCGVATGVGAVLNTAAVRPGSSVAVFGCGGVGLAVIQGARLAGASAIIALDPIAAKLSVATASGATRAVGEVGDAAVEAVLAATRGRGADYAFEVSGRADGLASAWKSTRRGGTVVPVGAQDPATPYPWTPAEQMFEGKRVLGCLYGSSNMRRDVPLLLDLIEAGRLDLTTMISKTISLGEVGEGLEALERGEVIRQVMVP
jgi:S-(hydroxymethyl)glutathione dehydrogenase/alcohol dehydrogenase